MSNLDQADELRRGVYNWNNWMRSKLIHDPTFIADLSLIGLSVEAIKDTSLWNPERWVEGAWLEAANFTRANLAGAHLEGAYLSRGNLQESILSRAHLQEAQLEDALMQGADLRNSELQHAQCYFSQMSEVKLCGAILHGTIFENAKMSSANLNDSELQRAKLINTNLRGAQLLYVNIDGASFDYSCLSDAQLTISSLDINTSFKDTNLSNCMVSITSNIDQETAIQVLAQGIVYNAQFADPVFGRKVRDQAWLNKWLHNIKLLKGKQRCKYRCMRFWEWFWRESSDYGRSMGRWIIWSLFFMVFFSLIYKFFPEGLHYDNGDRRLTPLYFSIVTFTTLGFGDVSPQQWWSELIVALEVVLGYVNLGGLISIFATKVARRND